MEIQQNQHFEYMYEQQQPIPILLSNSSNSRKQRLLQSSHHKNLSDTDSSYVPETTSESGISDLDMSEKCNCCPYGFHIDTDFVNFLDTLDGKQLIKQLKKIKRKRNERIQRSMEYVIDEVEKIRQISEEYNEFASVSQIQPAPPPPPPLPPPLAHSQPQSQRQSRVIEQQHHSSSFRRVSASPARSLVTDQLKRTIHKIDNEIDRDFDPYKAKHLIEQHRIQRHASQSPLRIHSQQNSPRMKHRALSSTTANNTPRRSRSGRRSKSTSKSPLMLKDFHSNHSHSHPHNNSEQRVFMSNDDLVQTVTTTTYHQPKPYYEYVLPNPIVQNHQQPVSQEVTLNLVSLTHNRLHHSDSSSSESLCSFDGLRINEDGTRRQHKQQPEPLKPQPTRYHTQLKTTVNTDMAELYKRIEELERKLNKLPELEIKNSVLLEERNQLIRQLNERIAQPVVVVESPKKTTATRDVGVLHQQEEVNNNEKKFIEMQAIISTLQEKLDEQTITLQKPQTRDVAIMHKVEEIKEDIEQRDVAINHETVDEQVINERLEIQKELMTSTFIKELDVLKQENIKLSSSLEEAIRSQSKSLITRGTHPIEQPQLYSIGCNTNRVQTRDVQVMYTPKCRDVALSTDRFNYTRDVSLYCNMDSFDDCGNEQISTLFELKKFGFRRRRYDALRDVCIGVNLIEPPVAKVTRDVRIGVDLDKLKEQRDVAIGCHLDVKPQTRDVCMKVNLDEKVMRDVCCGVELATIQKDASIFVNLIEPVIKPEVKHVNLQTGSSLFKDACISTELVRLRDSATEMTQVRTRDVLCGHDLTAQHAQFHKRDFCINVNFDDVEKAELKSELIRLRQAADKIRHDVSTSMDYTHRLNASLIHNASTGMDVPRVQSKFMNTDSVYTRETFTNTDFRNVSHKAIGDRDVNEGGVDVQEFNMIKSQLKSLEFEHLKVKQQQQQQKSVCTTGVGMCSVYDSIDLPKPKSHSVAVGNDNYVTYDVPLPPPQPQKPMSGAGGGYTIEETIEFEQVKRNVGPHILSINIEKGPPPPKVIEKRKETDYEERKVTRFDGQGKPTVVKESVTVKSEDEKGNRTSELWSNVHTTPDTTSTIKSVKQRAMDINESSSSSSSQMTTKVNVTNDKASSITSVAGGSTTSITIPVSSAKEYVSVSGSGNSDIMLGASSSIAKSTIASLQAQESTEEFATISTEEVVYKDGEVLEKHVIGKTQVKPKSILKTATTSPNSSVSSNKGIKFGGIIKGASHTDSEDDFDMDEVLTTYVHYETSGEPIVLPVNMELEECSRGGGGDASLSNISTIEASSTVNRRFNDEMMVGEEGELEEIEEFEAQEELSSLKDDESKDPTVFELELELHIACAILNESLYEPLKADKNKVAKALNLIQQDWFKIAAQKGANAQIVMDHLNAFYSRFSNLLLERIVNMADMNLNTALHYSVSQGNFEIVNLLLDTKVCDVNAQNIAGYTSIMLAAVVPITNDYERVTLKRLFSEGNVNIKSTDTCQTALMLAVRHGNKETVQLLLEAGADVNLQDKDGSTALMAACEHGYLDIVRILLDNSNCDPDIKDNDGENAFDIAKGKKRNDIVVLLYAHSSKLRSHHPAVQFAKSRPRIGSGSSTSSQRSADRPVNKKK